MTTEAELLQRWIAAADEVAQMRKNLNVEFCALFPSAEPETMAAGVDSILAEIQKRRREIEAAGGASRA
jgi:hypothetical protein